MIGGEAIDASIISIGLSHEDNEQIVFRAIWKPLRKSMGFLARQQLDSLKKYHALRQGEKKLPFKDIEWSDLDKLGQKCENYQLLLLDQDGLYRIKFDSVCDDQGRLSKISPLSLMGNLYISSCDSLISGFSFR